MWSIVKQIIKLFANKKILILSLILNIVTLVSISSMITTTISSIDQSLERINKLGNIATISTGEIKTNVTNNLYSIPEDKDILKPLYIEERLNINMNGINIDEYLKNPSLVPVGDFVIFPYEKQEIVDAKKINPKQVDTYCNTTNRLPAGVIVSTLEESVFPSNAAMGFSIIGNKFNKDKTDDLFLMDPRNIYYDKNGTVLGYYNNGIIDDKVIFSVTKFGYKNKQSLSNEYSKLDLIRESANDELVYKNYNSYNYDYELNFSNKNSLWTQSTQWEMTPYNYFNTLPVFDKAPPIQKNFPYKSNVPYYGFQFSINEKELSPDVRKFVDFLKIVPESNVFYEKIQELLHPKIFLDEFKITGLTRENFEKLNISEKKEIFSLFKISLNKSREVFKSNFDIAFNKFVDSSILKELDTLGLKYSKEKEFYYQDNISNHDFSVVLKDQSVVNKIVINDGQNFYNYSEHDDIMESFNNKINLPLYGETMSLESLLNFLKFFYQANITSTKYLSSKEITLAMLKLIATQSIINDNKSWELKKNLDIIKVANSPEWYQFILTYGEQNITTTRDISFDLKYGRGFLTTYDSKVFNYTILNNYFSILNTPYFLKNNKKTSPEVSLIEDGNEIFSYDDLSKKVREENFNIDNYISNLPNKYKMNINGIETIILGSGISPDYAFPVISLTSPIPDVKKQGVIYINNSLFNFLSKINNIRNIPLSYSIKTNNNFFKKNEIIKKLNDFSIKMFGTKNFLDIHDVNDMKNYSSISSLRYLFPKEIIFYLSVASTIIIFLLLLICIYIIYLLIKILIDKFKSSLAIIKANGISNSKIILAVLAPLVFIGAISSIIGYIINFAISQSLGVILSSFWFIPIAQSSFSPILFFGAIFAILLLIGSIVSIIIMKKMKQPILSTISNLEDIKINKLTSLIRNSSSKFSGISKLRSSLIINKMGKIFIVSVMMTFTFSLSISTFSIISNISNSHFNNNKTKKYEFAYDFITPTESTGLLKQQEYVDIGKNDSNIGIEPSLEVIKPVSPYEKMWAKDKNIFAIRDQNGIPIPNNFFSNFVLPSYYTYQKINNLEPNLGFNSSISIFLLDIDFPKIGNIYYDYLRPSLPLVVATNAEKSLEEFRTLIFEDNYLGKYFKEFLVKDVDDPTGYKHPIKIDSKKAIQGSLIDFNNICYDEKYLEFIGRVYGHDEVSQKDVKISFGIVPISKEDENYTYINAKYKQNEIRIMGIKDESKYIQLYNDKNHKINHKIKYIKGNNIMPIIINEGAKIKYKLKKGDHLNLKVLNDYYNSTNNFATQIAIANNIDFEINNNFEFKIVDISNDPIGETFYIDQELANEISNLDKGKFISKIKNVDTNEFVPSDVKIIEYVDNKNYVPFNGVFTNEKYPIIGNRNIPLISNIGLYSLNFELNDLLINKYQASWLYMNTTSTEVVKQLLQLNEKPTIVTEKQKITLKEMFQKIYSASSSIKNQLVSFYNNGWMDSAINSFDSLLLSDKLFSSTSYLMQVVQIISLSVFLPILFVVLLVSVLSILDELKKILLMMKILGFSESRIIRSVLYMFIIPIILTISVGTASIFAIVVAAKYFLLNMTSIYITISLNGLAYGLGILALIILIIIIGTIVIGILKYSNNKKAIINY